MSTKIHFSSARSLFLFLCVLNSALYIPQASSQNRRDENAISLSIECTAMDTQAKTILGIKKNENTFLIQAQTAVHSYFILEAQRPSLNVRIADGDSLEIKEYIDFHKQGLELVPVDSLPKLEIDIHNDTPQITYQNEDLTKNLTLTCAFNTAELLQFLGLTPQKELPLENVKAVAFDVDDTLLFSSYAIDRGFATGGTPRPEDALFWSQVNACDKGCPEETITLSDGSSKLIPATKASTPKTKALELIKTHRALGHKVYAITARSDFNGEHLRLFLKEQFGIEKENVFFEPSNEQPNNPAGKTDRIENLNLDIFYGDSDSDITDTQLAFLNSSNSKRVKAVRFLRSPRSSNRKAGKLNKYHPGYYGETILSDSY